ncbi:MAG: CBS domain-containing protein [Planctomycetes bacterium]|nr:CBS domain-containing protein [Planctomycetota bacterium]MCC7171040.1 CBS domain-containing protein [Planctomycetota bacterium]
MNTAKARLGALTARDLMVDEVITVDADAPIEEAVRILDEDQVSGLPVIDAAGKLVGMITSHDLARIDHERDGGIEARPTEPTLADVLDEADDDDDPVRLTEGFADAIVREFMTPAVISVSPSTTLKQICGVLARENIHRVVVTEHGKLLGIVTTTDIVRRLADDL